MVHKVILPDTCEPTDLDHNDLPKLVFMVFGLFRYDKEGYKGVHSTRGEWLIVDELLQRGDCVMAVQIAPRHNVRLIKDAAAAARDRKSDSTSSSPRDSFIRSGSEIGGGTRVGTNLSIDKVTGGINELDDDDYELHKEPNPDPRALQYPGQWIKVRSAFDSPSSIADVVQECIELYGRVDIVANWLDLGFDYGAFSKNILTGNVATPPTEVQQQQEEMELRKLMDQNTFSLFNIIKGTLPALRRNTELVAASSESTALDSSSSIDDKDKGKYRSSKSKNSSTTPTPTPNSGNNKPATVPKLISVSSSFGFVGGPGINAYTTSRWACEGMMETLNYEVNNQGIRTTTIDLGVHPLNTATANSLGTLVWELAHCRNPPIRIALGRQATKTVKDKLRSIVEEVEDWKYLFEPTKPKAKPKLKKEIKDEPTVF